MSKPLQPPESLPKIDYFKKNNVRALLLWPLICIAAGALMWGILLDRAHSDMEQVDTAGLKDATSHAEAYEHYVTRSLSQLDQVSMQLKYGWEHTAQRMTLEDLRREGMFTDQVFASVAIYGDSGARLSATGQLALPASIEQDAAFHFHKNNNSSALRMDVPAGQASGSTV